mgnify:CR=1 FL=1
MKYYPVKSVKKINLLGSLTILFLFFISIIIVILIQDTKNYNDRKETIVEKYEKQKKNEIRKHVLNKIEEFNFMKEVKLNHFKKKSYEKVIQVTKILSEHNTNLNLLEEKLSVLKLLFSNNSNYSVRIYTIKQELKFSNDEPLNIILKNQKHIIEKESNIAKTKKESFIQHTLTDSSAKKISYFGFLKYLPRNKLYIVIGNSLDNILKDTKKEIISHLNNVDPNDEYFFIYKIIDSEDKNYFAKMAVNPNRRDLVGKLVSLKYEDPNGFKFRKEMYKQIKNKGEAFIKYHYVKPNENKIAPKYSYFKLYPEWNWIVSQGFYYDDLDKIVAVEKSKLHENFKDKLKLTAFILLIFIFISLLVSFYTNKKIKTIIESYENKVKKHENELVKARDKAELSSKIKTQFLSNISHELRTPLNGIVGLTDILLRSKLKPEQLQELKMIQDSANKLNRLISDILDFSKIDTGKVELYHNSGNIFESLDKTYERYLDLTVKKDLKFNLDLDLSIYPYIWADFKHLKKVLFNLIDNSVKFTKTGYVQLSVKKEYEDEKTEKLKFSVKDTGIGIPKNRIKEIFNDFVQADNSLTKKHTGLGLTLSVSNAIVNSFNSELKVKSQVGKGSTFEFSILFDKSQPIQDRKISKSLKILLISDNETIKNHFTNSLKDLDKIKIHYIELDKFSMIFEMVENYDAFFIHSNEKIFNYLNEYKTEIKDFRDKFIILLGKNRILEDHKDLHRCHLPIYPKKIYKLLDKLQNSQDYSSQENRFLIIEKNPINIKIIEKFKELNAYTKIDITANLDEIIYLLRKFKYRIILINLSVKKQIFHKVKTVIKNTEYSEEVEIIAFSSFDYNEIEQNKIENRNDFSQFYDNFDLKTLTEIIKKYKLKNNKQKNLPFQKFNLIMKKYSMSKKQTIDLINDFLTQYPRIIASLRQHLKDKNFKSISRITRTLISLVSKLESENIKHNLVLLEKSSKNSNYSQVKNLIDTVSDQLHIFESSFEIFKQENNNK